jgi:DNA-binding NtrC family response regulator
LTVRDLPLDFGKSVARFESNPDAMGVESMTFHEAEKRLIQNALDKFAGNKSRAAEYLKIPRHVLIYRMKKYDLFSASH